MKTLPSPLFTTVRLRPTPRRIGLVSAILAGTLTFSVHGVGARAQASTSGDPDTKAAAAPANAVWVDSFDLSQVEQDWGNPHAGHSVDNAPITLGGVVYPHGIGTHAHSEFDIDLKGAATRFVTDVGLDDEKKSSVGAIGFEVWVDGKKKVVTDTLKGGMPPEHLSVDVTGAKSLRLVVNAGGDGIDSDHADWAGAMLVLAPGATAVPAAVSLSKAPVMPIFMEPDSAAPAIHGARVVGSTPLRPFLFRVAATGQGPLRFSARGLPTGLSLDSATGVISGSLQRPGQSIVDLTVAGPKGRANRKLVIVGGVHKLALTPPMGWNSWNVWATSVTADKVKAAADSFESSGLANHGFTYVNIDDAWEGGRAADGTIETNKKFGDMKALADYVHGKGLKLGIYSSPGPTTCAGYAASYQHEDQDAATWAAWGVDYIKYDWCSYDGVARGDHSIPALEKPYAVLRHSLDLAKRDIVYSLCQYGMGDSWTWAASDPIGGNCWRTTGDITDTWSSLKSIGFRQNGHEIYAGPGHWNDPDMLIVGKLGWSSDPHPTRLNGNEQITHISLWCLLSSPLLIGCDLTQIDPFTKALLTNDELLDINQDPLGKPASRKSQNAENDTEVWARPLFDGTTAVGLFNLSSQPAEVTAKWSDLGIKGRQPVRNVWLHKDMGSADGSFTITVAPHGAFVVKIGKPITTDYEPK